jgi:Leishmanolysin
MTDIAPNSAGEDSAITISGSRDERQAEPPANTYESYHATANVVRAQELTNATSPFTIEVRFMGGLNAQQQAAFRDAADRWTKVIVGDLPSVEVDGETIDDVLILADGSAIDGTGGVLGQAGPTVLRPASAGAAAMLPAKGVMSFDTADLAQMQRDGTLGDVIAHEMGHVLGIGTIWPEKNLLRGAGTPNPTFVGPTAMSEYATLLQASPGSSPQPLPQPQPIPEPLPVPQAQPVPVPVENTGGVGTRDSHWRETTFRNELMSGFIAAPSNPLSRVTVASLADLGYQVDLAAADPYTLPDQQVALQGEPVIHTAPIDRGVMQPVARMVLPDE